jgi:hypothetical protein
VSTSGPPRPVLAEPLHFTFFNSVESIGWGQRLATSDRPTTVSLITFVLYDTMEAKAVSETSMEK